MTVAPSPAAEVVHPLPALDRRLVRVGSAGIVVVGAVGTVHNLLLGISPLATLALALSAAVGLSLLVALRRGASTRRAGGVFVGTILAALAVSWFSAGGVRSSVGTLAPVLACFGVLVLPTAFARHFLATLAVLFVGLVALEVSHPDWVSAPIPGWPGLLDHTVAALLAIVIVGSGTAAMRRLYVQQHEVLLAQKEQVSEGRRRLEEALAAAERSAAAKSLFLAYMSHELRTPLAGVVGYADLLQREPLPSDSLRLVDALGRSSRHLERLIEDLLDLGRMERDDLVLRFSEVDLRELLRDAMRDATSPSGPQLALHVEGGVPARIRTDGARLRQVVTNLLVNAVRHASAQKVTVTVTVGREQQLRIVVEDDGRGIPSDELPHVFEAFERDAASTAGGGLGLGLYIVRGIVSALSGELNVESTVGRGSRFSVEVPCAAADEAKPVGAGGPVVEAPAPRSLRVLSADDDASVRAVLRAMFAALGVDATVVDDGEVAIERAAENHYDAVFLDMNMAGVSGADAARAIRDRAEARAVPCPRLVALTASAYPSDIERCMSAGMSHFLSKPVRLADLEAVLTADHTSAGAGPDGSRTGS